MIQYYTALGRYELRANAHVPYKNLIDSSRPFRSNSELLVESPF